MAGVGTNLSTLGPVMRLMRRRTAVLYGARVVVLACSLGVGLNLTLSSLGARRPFGARMELIRPPYGRHGVSGVDGRSRLQRTDGV
jgi:hypothetical protein